MDGRFHRERAGELHPLHHAARKLVRVTVLESFQTDEVCIAVGNRRALRFARVAKAKHQILSHRQPRKHGALLRNQNAVLVRSNPRCLVNEHTA